MSRTSKAVVAASDSGVIPADAVRKSKEAIVFALCNRVSIDPIKLTKENIEESNIVGLFSIIVQLSEGAQPSEEVLKWVKFAGDFSGTGEEWYAKLTVLNEQLAQKSVLLGFGFKPSHADIVVFATLHPYVNYLGDRDKQELPHLMRWMDYIQNTENFGGLLDKVQINKLNFNPPALLKKVDKVDIESTSKAVTSGPKDPNAVNSQGPPKVLAEDKAPTVTTENATAVKKNKASEEKKKEPEVSSEKKDTDCNVSVLNIQVGLIRKAWKHPSADSLLVEEIDLGEGNIRQVVSGLAKYCSPDELVNRYVVLITNVKPGKLRDVMSAGLVLCASNQDHTVVEPLIPPEGVQIGERIVFTGYDGKPEDVLNPKKKQLEKITPDLYTDGNGIATYKGVPFTTSAGPCRSSIPNASIK